MIDKLAYSSRLRNKSPFLKMLFAVGTLLICVSGRSFVVSFLTMALMGYLTVTYSRISLFAYFKMMCAPFAFLIFGTIAIAVNFSHTPLDLYSVAVGSGYLTVSSESLLYAIRLIVVSLASLSSLYFLALTTTMIDMIAVLRHYRCPWIVIELMMLMYRYIFVLLDMASAMITAQNCRLGNRTIKARINGMGMLLSVLLVKALDKSRKLFDAMESRCYDGEIQVLNESIPAQPREKVAASCFLITLLVVSIICKLLGGI